MQNIQELTDTAISLAERFDTLPIVFLALLSFFMRIAFSYLSFTKRVIELSNLLAWGVVPLYLVHHYRLGNLDLPGDALPVILRICFGAYLGAAILSCPLQIVANLWASHVERRSRRRWRRQQEEAEKYHLSRPTEPPKPQPIPRKEQRQRNLEQLREDYRQELAMIDEAQLGRRHRHFARQDAKQRYLRRLKSLLET